MTCGAAGMWLFSVVTGLLVAEVNINTMCQLGRGGAGMTIMAERTLGTLGARGVTASYLFLHGAMLVACEPSIHIQHLIVEDGFAIIHAGLFAGFYNTWNTSCLLFMRHPFCTYHNHIMLEGCGIVLTRLFARLERHLGHCLLVQG